MELMEFKSIKENLYYEVLDNGLKVYLVPKNDFNKTFAVFSTNYGSLDNRFIPYDKNEYVEYPLGIAHFLEHKLFEMEDGVDASTKFLQYGASSNAFTSYNQTSYLFSTTSYVKECINMLLDFVQKPYFTDSNVLKEKGIISQEINMYQDYPDYRAQMEILKNLYKDNFIKNEIAGSVKSINKITKEMLYSCYYTFYQPSNMELFVIGNFNLDEIIDTIRKNQSSKKFNEPKEIKRDYISDIHKRYKSSSKLYMDISMPKLSIGFRFDKVIGNYQIEDLKMSILMQILFGDSSDFQQELLDLGLINESFGYYTDLGVNSYYGFLISDTKNPKELYKRFIKYLKNIPNYQISIEDFVRAKNSYVGKFISMVNSLDNTATSYSTYSFGDNNLYDLFSIINNFTLDDIDKMKSLFRNAIYTKNEIFPNEYKK